MGVKEFWSGRLEGFRGLECGGSSSSRLCRDEEQDEDEDEDKDEKEDEGEQELEEEEVAREEEEEASK